MTDIFTLAALWLGLALAATLLSIWLRIATAMSEIVVGTVAQLAIGAHWWVPRCSAPISRGSASSPAPAPSCSRS